MLIGLVGTECKPPSGAAPPVTVTVNKAAAQPDPTNQSPILFTIVFSEAVTGFTNLDLNYTGTTAGGTMVGALTGGPTTWTASITGMTTSGNVGLNVPASACTSSATGVANQLSTSTDNIVQWDVIAPTVTVNKEAGQSDPTTGSFVLFTAVFSEPVVGFATSDISFTGSTCGGTLSASITGTGPTYTITVSGMAAPNGNVVCSLPANSVTDLAGNLNSASTHTDNIVAWTGAPAGAWYTLYDQTSALTTASNGWDGYCMAQYIAPAAYGGTVPATCSKMRVTVKTGASGAIFSSGYGGHSAPSGDVVDFDGTQISLLWGGSASGTVGANTTRLSDEMTYAFDKTKGLVLRMKFNGASDVMAASGISNFQRTFAIEVGGSDVYSGQTNITVDGAVFDIPVTGIYLFCKVEVFG